MVHSPDEQLLHDVADAAPSVLTSHRAHALLLCTRSGFFARALSAGFIEQERRVVHLGIVEELGLWRPGEDPSYVLGAFHALVRYFYTGRHEVEARFALDLLALLEGDFLQLESTTEALSATCEAAALAAPLEEIGVVAARAHHLGFLDLAEDSLRRMAGMLDTAK
ncbi:BTB domain-containing protein, partial [Durusdinium trenchii]